MELYNLELIMYQILSSNQELTSLVSGIYSVVPENVTYPYVLIGEDELSSFGTKTFSGKIIKSKIHVYDDTRGNIRVKKILSLIEQSLKIAFTDDQYYYEYFETESVSISHDVSLPNGTIKIIIKCRREI